MQINSKDINVIWETYQTGYRHNGSIVPDIEGDLVVKEGAFPRIWYGVFEVYKVAIPNYIQAAEVPGLYEAPYVTFTDEHNVTHHVIWAQRPTVVWISKGAQIGHVSFQLEEIL